MSVPALNDKGAIQSEDQRYEVVRGKVNGIGFIRKSGKNSSPASGVAETVWDGSTAGDYPFPSEDVASGVIITSDNDADGDDAASNQGAQSVHIYGLVSGTWALADEIVAMSGTSVNDYIRIYEAHAEIVGTSGTNAGNISVKMNTVEVAKIGARNGQSLMAVYTIPSGVTGYLDEWSANIFADGTVTIKVGNFELLTRSGTESGTQSRRIQDTIGLKDATFSKDMKYPLEISEMTDVWLNIIVDTIEVIVTGGFNIRLENNA